MTNLTINNKAHTIEMTKKFEKAASRFGSDEYKVLQEARKDYPTYKVVVKTSTTKSKESFKGLTYDYMEKYIDTHDKEGTTKAEFEMLRGTSVEAKEALAEACSYQEIKAWFFNKFPEIKTFHEKRTKMLEKAEDTSKVEEAAEVKASPAA